MIAGAASALPANKDKRAVIAQGMPLPNLIRSRIIANLPFLPPAQ
jgi:hypothetical protein